MAGMITNLARHAQGFTSNVFLVEGDRTVVIDAGSEFDVVARVRDHVDRIDALVLTHTHPDHIGNVDELTASREVDCFGYATDHPAVDRGIEDGETIQLGDREYEALFTPGHATDHLCFLSTDGEILFAGDLIFPGGNVGRTDFEGGDTRTLAESVERVTDRIDDSLRELYAGHGPAVTSEAAQHVARARELTRTQF